VSAIRSELEAGRAARHQNGREPAPSRKYRSWPQSIQPRQHSGRRYKWWLEPCEHTIRRAGAACPVLTRHRTTRVALVFGDLLRAAGGERRRSAAERASGLGCPDGPRASQHHLTAVSSFHPIVEFANRLVEPQRYTLVSVAALAMAALRTAPRRDSPCSVAGLVGRHRGFRSCSAA